MCGISERLRGSDEVLCCEVGTRLLGDVSRQEGKLIEERRVSLGKHYSVA